MKSLIIKFLTNSATEQEIQQLGEWIKTTDNKVIFEEYIEINKAINKNIKAPDKSLLEQKLLAEIKRKVRGKKITRIHRYLKYAALIVLFISVGSLIVLNKKTFTKEVVNNPQEEQLIIPEEQIILRLENGNTKIVASEGENQIINNNGQIIGLQKGSLLQYSNTNKIEKLVYNELAIPNGKRYKLKLSDGSIVHLNSGTSIRYPVKFIKDKPRKVFIKGEGFFAVTKDLKHPFVVNLNGQDIKVLGTKFNVSHYPEDNEKSNVVLVEGSVQLLEEGINSSNTYLKPGEKGEWDNINKATMIETVDTYIYTSWVEGKIVFRNNTFKKIRKQLERHYNITILNSNEELDMQIYDATFDIESIYDVMESFNESFSIEYSITDNKIIINK